MDADLIADIIQVLTNSLLVRPEIEKNMKDDNVLFSIEILQAMSKTGRFSLNMSFFDKSQQEHVSTLFLTLEDALQSEACKIYPQETLMSLKSLYILP